MKTQVQPEVGMGVTVSGYTDRTVYTIVRVSPSGKSFWVKSDTAIISPDFKPKWHPGGFAGHVSNQHEITYTYEHATGSKEHLVRLTKDGRWSLKGNKRVALGIRSYFYDYNF